MAESSVGKSFESASQTGLSPVSEVDHLFRQSIGDVKAGCRLEGGDDSKHSLTE